MAKARYRIRNWTEYNRSLVARGDVMLWFDEGVVNAWYWSGTPKPNDATRNADLGAAAVKTSPSSGRFAAGAPSCNSAAYHRYLSKNIG